MTRHGHKLKLANCDLTKTTKTTTTKTRIQPGTEDKGKAKYTGEITRGKLQGAGGTNQGLDKTTQRLNKLRMRRKTTLLHKELQHHRKHDTFPSSSNNS